MQMPARSENVRQLRPAHEGGMIAMAACDLLYRRAKQHHVVGGLDAFPRGEGELALARTELDLDRAQGQADREDVAAEDVDNRLDLVEALLGQVLIAMRQQAHRRRPAG